VWFTTGDSIGRITTADSVVASPNQGPAGTAESITGAGYSPAETVVVKYLTGLTSPASVKLCTTTAGADGTFACTATIPANAGVSGTHTIKAVGKTSNTAAKTTFLVTVPD
jgi:hypothetical protein